jgi:hypothetical protein
MKILWVIRKLGPSHRRLGIFLKFDPRDLWLGLYWDVGDFWADLYLVLIPMLPIHFSWIRGLGDREVDCDCGTPGGKCDTYFSELFSGDSAGLADANTKESEQ